MNVPITGLGTFFNNCTYRLASLVVALNGAVIFKVIIDRGLSGIGIKNTL